MKQPLWLIRLLRYRRLTDEQKREAEAIRRALEIKRRGQVAGMKVLAMHIAKASGL